jgi:indole-3-glycerol phosphate synthase
MRSVSRFSQAISDGEGISVIPLLEGDLGELATLAEQAGAEAVAVWSLDDVAAVRSRCSLPVLVRAPSLVLDDDLRFVSGGEADACVLAYERFGGEEDLLERLYETLSSESADCVAEVRDEEQLEEVLDRVDPEVILTSGGAPEMDWENLERTLDLLPDVPAGKLVISEAGVVAREQVVALERAGVDAIVVGALFLRESDFAASLAELTGR